MTGVQTCALPILLVKTPKNMLEYEVLSISASETPYDEMLTLGKGQFKRQYGNFKKKEEELPDEIKKLLDE